jgi:hypothetical protein
LIKARDHVKDDHQSADCRAKLGLGPIDNLRAALRAGFDREAEAQSQTAGSVGSASPYWALLACPYWAYLVTNCHSGDIAYQNQSGCGHWVQSLPFVMLASE